jgi:rod shape-determining protein MreC
VSAIFASRQVRRRAITYGALLVTSVLLMAVSANPMVRDLEHGIAFAFRPVQVAVDGVAGTVISVGTALSDIDRLRIENEALRNENQQLKTQQAVADEIARENDQLTGLLQVRSGLRYQTAVASVIARDSSEAKRALMIDRGTDDGVAVGDVVIAAGGALAGRITDVGPNFAQVTLISDSSSTVIGQLLSSGATGQVIGQLGGALVMQDVDSMASVSIGEEVFTAGIELGSGLRSPYPKGLLIGQVVDVARDPNEVVQTVFLEPAAALDHLEYLLVITDYQGGLNGPLETQTPCTPNASGTLPDSDQPCPSQATSTTPPGQP